MLFHTRFKCFQASWSWLDQRSPGTALAMIKKGLAEDALGRSSQRGPAEPNRVIRNDALALDLGRCIPVKEVSMN